MASTINITKSSPGNIIITGKWTWYDYYKVEYSWENAPDGVTLPETINKIKNGSIIAVDTTYSSSSEVDTNDYYYTFSGWNKSGNITVNADTTITGIWTQNRYLTVSYSWTDAPTSVTLPNSTTKLKPGDSVTVDTTYNSSSEVDTDIKEKVVLSERSISNTNRKWTSVCYGNGKFVAVDNTNYFAYSNDGITWSESTISDTSRQWTSVCYGNGKFVAVGSGDDNQHVGGSTSNTKNFAYSTDGIKWTEGALGYDVEWSSVCYGNGKFVAVSNSFNYFAYSTDGINWTKGTISSTSRYWNSVCYGNNKYVAVGSHTEASGGTYSYFAYSTDGITWTEGTISSTSRYWNSVCYGNGMFVTVASGTNYFAYSTDGINWTEDTISSTSRNWRSVCYGNGMFVAVANNSYFAYSTDGINWTEDTISSTSRNWRSVCYGNDKFVAIAYNSNYFAYSTDSAYYYTFSGWDQTGNITVNADTTITGIWTLNKYLSVLYSWIDEPDGVTLPNTVNKLKPNDTVTVDTTYNSDSEVDTDTCYYTFSGWNQTGDIIVTSDTVISGVWTIHDYLKVSYSWTNAPSSVALPKTVTNLKPGDSVTVDTTYNSSSEVDTNDYYYTFSGWDKNGNITVNADTTITGIWTQNKYLTVSYSWTDAPNGVTLPNSTTKLKPGDSVTVDTTYNSSSIKELDPSVKIGKIGSSSSGRYWRSVCYGNGKFVTVSGGSNASNYFAYSTNGINWTEGTISSTAREWQGVCYGNGKFVAVASGTNYSAYSTDGITWTERTISSTNRDWWSVCYGNGKFVAVGYNMANFNVSSSAVAYSTDGINWTEGTISSTAREWQGVCYGNDKFVAVAYSSNYSAYSTDGINWTESTISSDSTNLKSVCYGNGKFVAVGSNKYLYYSTDGIKWKIEIIHNATIPWQEVCYGNNKFVAVDKDNNEYFAYFTDSTYYYQFSGWNQTGNITVTKDTVISGVWSQKNYLTVSYSWTDAPTNLMSTVPNSCGGFKPGDTYTVDSNYTNLTAKKDVTVTSVQTDVAIDSNWSGNNTTTDASNINICYGNDKFVIVGHHSYLAYSFDGITWTKSTISSNDKLWLSVCYGNDKFVAVGSKSYLAYSTDGINWTEGTISNTSRKWESVCYGNDKFVAVAQSTNYFAYSTDGITWTEGTISNTSRNWYSVCYGNGKFITVAYNDTYFAYSTNGINWTEGTISSTSRNWKSICYGNGKFVAVANSNYFAYSTDGINWTQAQSDTATYWDSVCYGNGKFVTGGCHSYQSSYYPVKYSLKIYMNYIKFNNIYYQFSGWNRSGNITVNNNTEITGSWSKKDLDYNWTKTTICSTSRGWRSICYGNGKFVATAFQKAMAYSTDGITWTEYSFNGTSSSNPWLESICYGNGKFVIVIDNSKYFAYSTDGITWTEVMVSDTSKRWTSVCYGNGKYVAVASSSNYFAYSTDGINWTEGTISSTSRNWKSICYGNDKFVVVGYNTDSNSDLISGNDFAYSTDGITWTEGTISETSRKRTSVCYGNGKYVAVASSSNYFAYSTDGINWTEVMISDTKRYWNSVCYGDGKYVAVGSDSYFAYSADGITWTEGTISDTSNIWGSVCYGDGKFVAVMKRDKSKVCAYYSKQFPSNLTYIN